MRRVLLLISLITALVISLPGMTAAAPFVLVDGQPVSFEVPPVIEHGRVLVPIRGIAEALGATVDWEGSTKTLELSQGDTYLKLQIGSSKALKNNRWLRLDAVPKIVHDRTLVPLRFISEAFGASVSWDDSTRTVSISQVLDEAPDESLEKQVFNLTNSIRAEHGLKPFKWDDRLAEVARQHSENMRDQGFFSHDNPDGETPFDRMKEAGIIYRAAAENIAVGYRDASSVLEGWMNSPGHRENILGDYEYIGIGIVYGGEYQFYYTQDFYTPQ